MYTTYGMFRHLMALPSRTLTARGLITYPDTETQELTSEHIISFRIADDAGSDLPLGGASASTLSLRLDNRENEWIPGGSILDTHTLDGAIIELEIGVEHPEYSETYPSVDGGAPDEEFEDSYDGGAPDEEFEEYLSGGVPDDYPSLEIYWANIGTYVCETPIITETIEIKGADYLGNYALEPFTDGLSYPQTIAQIITEACSQCGITLKSSSFVNSSKSIATKPIWLENITCRDIISYCACAGAGFARIDRDGLLEIVAFSDTPSYELDASRYIDLVKSTSYGAFNALNLINDGSTVRVATEAIDDTAHNSLTIQNNPLLDSSALTNMLASMTGLSFDSVKTTWQGDPTVMPGDVVAITDKDSNEYNLLVLKQSLDFNSSFRMVSENSIRTLTKANSKFMRVFTANGGLNAVALEGNVYIKAGENLHLAAGGVFTVDSGNFAIDEDGNVTITGTITANDGSIGGFTIGDTTISSDDLTLDSENNKLTLKNLALQNDTVITGWGSIRMSEGHGFAVSADEFIVYIDDDTSTDNRGLCLALDYNEFTIVPDAYFAADVSALTFTDRP
jgi:hypothetical protein